ncbi:class I SAM-dependent methyltransferase [Pseudoalteromonas luteoviolacea]|uniref:class I SAM-dependent methyltransferase n=1 Tax=Pseudoalteromonas luteoviolacea TaxID=43657 RepID=UPI001F2569E9|nr:class I SAM-dependent methyltransferase [Pseudoalteromonas luteoviolacea]MCF6442569.1 class I SAM-dependent methyltransferase [Pseudoalteromonas luteoviolacea]
MSESTFHYYSQHAQEFADATLNVDMQPLYTPFLQALQDKPNSQLHILDAGCGSGRDALAFKKQGFQVSAMDACPELVEIASNLLNQPVQHAHFESFNHVAEFDGIWACASLLHVEHRHLPRVMQNLEQALKPKGVMYASFKHGQGERIHGERHFSDLDEKGLAQLLEGLPSLDAIKVWVTEDRRPGRENELWLNCLLRKD